MTARTPWVVLYTLLVGSFVMNVSTTSVNTAIPAISGDLHATVDQVLWVTSGYTLTTAVLVIIGGRLGDLYGQKRLYVGGLAVYTLGSVCCGLAPSAQALIAARVLQAVGAALVSPQSLSMISKVFPPERRGAAIGLWGAVAGGAVAIGPSLGGFMVSALGWRWTFLVNVPVCAVAAVLAWLIVPNLGGGRRHRLDLAGSGLACVGLLLVTYGFIEGHRYHWGTVWGPVSIPLLIIAGLLALVAFVLVERRRQGREPLLPFAILRNRNFSLMAAVNVTLFGGVGAMLLLLSIYLQSAVGMSALGAGLIMAIAPAISVAISPVAGRLTDRVGGKPVLMVGTTLFAAGLIYLIVVARADSSWPSLVPGLVLIGVAMGVTFAPPNAIAMHEIDTAVAGAASGTLNTIRSFGGVLGAALVGAILQVRLATALFEAADDQAARLAPGSGEALLAGVRRAAASGLEIGRGQFAVSVPDGLSAAEAESIRHAAQQAFEIAVTNAVRVTLLLPAGLLLLSTLLTVAVRKPRPAPVAPEPERALESRTS